MGGRIWLDSTVGTGSTFHCTIRFDPPLNESNEDEQNSTLPTPESVSGPLRILVAEDNPVNQKVASGLLERAGHVVTIAENGKRAVAEAERLKYDVILMDVQMPEMDGLEATRQIRELERHEGRRVPIVAMTAHAMQGDRERCLEAGMDGYISKPVSIEAMLDAIAGTIEDPQDVPAGPSADARPSDNGLNVDLLIERTGGASILAEIATMFVEGHQEQMTELREALIQEDAVRVKNAAHKIKGSLLVFELSDAADLAYQLEALGTRADIEEASPLFEDLEQEIQRALPGLRALCDLED